MGCSGHRASLTSSPRAAVVALVAVLGLAVPSACGGSPSSPGGGDGTPTVSSIAVTVTTPLKVGQSAQATATATLSNGATEAVTSGWQSDAAGVATVSAIGVVAGVANGNATISIQSGGRQGQQVVRVVPDYDGTWTGTYLVTSCAESGYFTDQRFCAGTLNTSAPVRFTLTQSGTAVSSVFRLGQLSFPATAPTIAADGSLATGDTTLAETVRIVASWMLQQATAGALTGTTRQRWTVAGQTGEGVLDGRIETVSRATILPLVSSFARSPVARTLAQALTARRAGR